MAQNETAPATSVVPPASAQPPALVGEPLTGIDACVHYCSKNFCFLLRYTMLGTCIFGALMLLIILLAFHPYEVEFAAPFSIGLVMFGLFAFFGLRAFEERKHEAGVTYLSMTEDSIEECEVCGCRIPQGAQSCPACHAKVTQQLS